MKFKLVTQAVFYMTIIDDAFTPEEAAEFAKGVQASCSDEDRAETLAAMQAHVAEFAKCTDLEVTAKIEQC